MNSMGCLDCSFECNTHADANAHENLHIGHWVQYINPVTNAPYLDRINDA
jgi:hypothetical protein